MRRIYPVFLKRVTQVISGGTATAIFNEKVQRSEGLGSGTKVQVSDKIQRGESEIIKTLGLVDTIQRGDAYRIPTSTITGADKIQRSQSQTNIAPLILNETLQRGDKSTTILTYKSAGTFTWNAPFTGNVQVELWGAGGGGGGNTSVDGAGGGGGAAYAKLNAFAVTKGTNYTIVVPAGATQTNNGASATFNSTSCVAAGGSAGQPGNASAQGAGGAGGSAAASTGDVKNAGGAGGGGATATTNGGGGGSSGSPAGAVSAGNSNGSGATAGTDKGGGGTGATSVAGATAGTQPGGGGGGTSALQSGIPTGGDGMARLTYTF